VKFHLPFCVALFLAYSATTRANDAPASSSEPSMSLLPEPAKTERRWYGAPMLAIDGVTFAIALVGTGLFVDGATKTAPGDYRNEKDDGGVIVVISGAVYAFSGPFAHGDHDHWGMAFASFGLRTTLPCLAFLAGAGFGALTDAPNHYSGAVEGAVIGFGIGVLGAFLLDDLLLARDTVAPAATEHSSAFQILPTFAPIKNGASVGVIGVF
jgi:hypothetical protein